MFAIAKPPPFPTGDKMSELYFFKSCRLSRRGRVSTIRNASTPHFAAHCDRYDRTHSLRTLRKLEEDVARAQRMTLHHAERAA